HHGPASLTTRHLLRGCSTWKPTTLCLTTTQQALPPRPSTPAQLVWLASWSGPLPTTLKTNYLAQSRRLF
ncbi:hypothetical protein GGF47_004995, partial [Coemansia sp. RSA 2524]